MFKEVLSFLLGVIIGGVGGYIFMFEYHKDYMTRLTVDDTVRLVIQKIKEREDND